MNLTITVDDETLKRARLRALEENTSVNSLVRNYLKDYAGASQKRRQAVQRLLTLASSSKSGRGDAVWSRDELHDR